MQLQSLLLMLPLAVLSVKAERVIKHDWTIAWKHDQCPDGQSPRKVLSVNGQFPPYALVRLLAC